MGVVDDVLQRLAGERAYFQCNCGRVYFEEELLREHFIAVKHLRGRKIIYFDTPQLRNYEAEVEEIS